MNDYPADSTALDEVIVWTKVGDVMTNYQPGDQVEYHWAIQPYPWLCGRVISAEKYREIRGRWTGSSRFIPVRFEPHERIIRPDRTHMLDPYQLRRIRQKMTIVGNELILDDADTS